MQLANVCLFLMLSQFASCAYPIVNAANAAESGNPPASKLGKLNPLNAAKAAKEKLSKSMKPAEPPAQLRDKWALLVGLENFHDNTIRPHKYAQQNAVLMSSFLANPDLGRFGQSRVVIVTNNKATKSNVSKALGDTWLQKKALPNDLVLLYFATRAKLTADGTDLLLYMFDAPASQPELGSIALKETLRTLKQSTGSNQILCLLDLAPANTKQDAQNRDKDSEAESSEPVNEATKATLAQIAKETGTTILSATEIGGRNYPSSTKHCSYFVENLLEGFATSKGQVEFEQVAQFVTKMVKDKVATEFRNHQIPVLALPDDSQPMMKTVICSLVKSSVPEKPAKIGHPPERAPEPVRTASNAQQSIDISPKDMSMKVTKSPITRTREEQESYDDASFGNVDFGPYMDKMKKDIQAKWTPPKGFDTLKVVTVFTIKKDGSIVNADIVDGSGNEDVDKSAMEALSAASPLDPLPQGSPPYVQIRYQFDWKVTKK